MLRAYRALSGETIFAEEEPPQRLRIWCQSPGFRMKVEGLTYEDGP